MKKKIAILSLYYKNANYGAVLQAYALQKAIENLGYVSQQISYELHSGYNYKFYTKLHLFMNKLISRFKYRKYKENIQSFENSIAQFVEEIPHTDPIDYQNIKSLAEEFDGFVCGSDQIWNPMGWQPAFFLDFVPDNKIKIAYAASVAREHLSENEIVYINQYIHRFSAVSVRENISRIQLNEVFPGREVSLQPDPVFLLDKSEWMKLVLPRSENKTYIFAYFLGNNFSLRDELIEYAKKNNKKILFIPYMKEYSYEWDAINSNCMYEKNTVRDFLSLIYFCEFVVTDSFHGAAMSLLLEKPFYLFDRHKEENRKSMNSRLDTLLGYYDLPCIRISSVENMKEKIEEEFMWDEIREVTKELRKRGCSYLREALKEQM